MTPTFTARPVPVIAEGLFSYDIGGSERLGATLAREFKARGYNVLCFAVYGSHGPIRVELESQGIECLDLNSVKRPRWVRRVTYPLAVARVLHARHVDIVHLHHATSLIAASIGPRIAGSRLFVTEHDLAGLSQHRSYRWQAKTLGWLAESFTVIHQGMVPFFTDVMGVSAPRVRFIPNGVAVQREPWLALDRAAWRARIGLGANDFGFIFVGRLSPVKDIGTMLEGFASLDESSRRNARLVLVGDGPQRALLMQLAATLGLADKVTFLGVQSNIPSLLHAADGFIMTSISEGQPLAMLEAMGAGLPCIGTAVGGIPNLLADGVGLLIPPNNPNAAGAAMKRLIDDAELRRQFADRAGRSVQANHSLDQMVSAYLATFRLPPCWPS